LPALRSFVAARSLPGIDVDEVDQESFIEAYQGCNVWKSPKNGTIGVKNRSENDQNFWQSPV
jgi:hypothetical protein